MGLQISNVHVVLPGKDSRWRHRIRKMMQNVASEEEYLTALPLSSGMSQSSSPDELKSGSNQLRALLLPPSSGSLISFCQLNRIIRSGRNPIGMVNRCDECNCPKRFLGTISTLSEITLQEQTMFGMPIPSTHLADYSRAITPSSLIRSIATHTLPIFLISFFPTLSQQKSRP